MEAKARQRSRAVFFLANCFRLFLADEVSGVVSSVRVGKLLVLAGFCVFRGRSPFNGTCSSTFKKFEFPFELLLWPFCMVSRIIRVFWEHAQGDPSCRACCFLDQDPGISPDPVVNCGGSLSQKQDYHLIEFRVGLFAQIRL